MRYQERTGRKLYFRVWYKWLPLLIIISLQMPFLFAQETKTVPKDSRLFSIAITLPEIEDISNFWDAYEKALDLAIATGIDLPGELPFTWSKIEKRNVFGKISYRDDNTLKAIEILKRKGLPVVITIAPFETANNRIPKDLRQLPYDDSKVIERFEKFIDWVYEVTDGLDVVAIVLGNEFDIHLAFQAANGSDRWDEFERMAAQTKSYVKSLNRWRAAPFALEPTYDGLTGPYRHKLQRINQLADVIGVSYYPLKENSVHEPTILGKHLTNLFKLYPHKKIDFYQYGYPSSTRINGSLEKQRQFIEETFNKWDMYNDKIRLITFTWLYDVQQVHIEGMGTETLGSLPPSQAFVEFLGSLGLHGQKVGSEKPAFKELKKQLQLRGWLD